LGNEGQRTLRHLPRAGRTDRAIRRHWETRSPREGQIEIPLLRLLNAERETGGVAVEVLGAGEIKDLKSEGLESADATDLGEMVSNRQSPSLAAFRFRSGAANLSRSLSLNVARYTPKPFCWPMSPKPATSFDQQRREITRPCALRRSKQPARLSQDHFAARCHAMERIASGQTCAARAISGRRPPLAARQSARRRRGAGVAVEVFYLTRALPGMTRANSSWLCPHSTCLSPVPDFSFTIRRSSSDPEPGAFRTAPYENPLSAALNPPVTYSGAAGGVVAATESSPGPPLRRPIWISRTNPN